MNADPREPRWRTLELVIAVSVVAISLASLFTAVYQSIVMQRTLEASVWPRVEWENSSYDEERRSHAITFALANRGVGPARIARVEILLGGKRVPSARALLLACCVDGANQQERASALRAFSEAGEITLFTSTVDGAAISPGQERVLVELDRPAELSPAHAIWQKLNQVRDELDLNVCYCSVFDDCWTTRARAFTQATEPVRDCPSEGEPGFAG